MQDFEYFLENKTLMLLEQDFMTKYRECAKLYNTNNDFGALLAANLGLNEEVVAKLASMSEEEIIKHTTLFSINNKK